MWIPVFAVLVAFAIPWPLWGVDLVVAGLPVWIWWHVGWLVLCTLLFARFVASGTWERGMGIDPTASNPTTSGPTVSDADADPAAANEGDQP